MGSFFADIASPLVVQLARYVLLTFLLTFVFTRTLVYMMAEGRVRNRFLHVGGTHIHHLNYGIFLLAGVGGILLFWDPAGQALDLTAAAYGVGMALTFDEFGMWLHLDDNYWQRASWDAVMVVGSLLGLLAFAPSLSEFGPRHWVISGIVLAAVVGYGYVLVRELRTRSGPRAEKGPARRA